MTFEGGTQNRAAIYPFIVPPQSGAINIPVHCVERGQGLVQGKTFRKSSTILMASARTTETTGSGATLVGQTRTWMGISRATSTFGLRENVTQDYTAVGRAEGTGLVEYVAATGKAQNDQLGYIAAVRNNGQVFFYADIFGQRRLYQKLHEKLAQSVAAVARQVFRGDITLGKDDFYKFLDEARTAELQEQKVDAQLLGKIYTADKPVNGIALMLEDSPVQLSLRRDEYSGGLPPDPLPTRLFSRQSVRG